jgi:protease II
MGTEAARDVLLFGAEYKDDKITWLSASEDRRYYAAFVAFGAGEGGRRDVFLMDRQAGGGFRPVVTGVDASFNGEFGGAKLYLRTNWKAPNWRLVEVDPHSPAPANWREVFTISGARRHRGSRANQRGRAFGLCGRVCKRRTCRGLPAGVG